MMDIDLIECFWGPKKSRNFDAVAEGRRKLPQWDRLQIPQFSKQTFEFIVNSP